MKRSPIARRSAPHRKTAIRTQNPERQAKRRIRQATKHRAYMRSETRKIVDARAAGRCEAHLVAGINDVSIRHVLGGKPDAETMERLYSGERLYTMRCLNRARQHHHLTYFRYGGDELPEDMLKVCRRCHEWLERQDHPTRQSHLRQTGRARQETE